MKYIVSMMNGSEIECDDFSMRCRGKFVFLFKNKSWRENTKKLFKTESIVVEDSVLVKVVKGDDVQSIDVKE
jgi:hypothetical protein